MKKLLSILLALAMVLSLSCIAFASDEPVFLNPINNVPLSPGLGLPKGLKSDKAKAGACKVMRNWLFQV